MCRWWHGGAVSAATTRKGCARRRMRISEGETRHALRTSGARGRRVPCATRATITLSITVSQRWLGATRRERLGARPDSLFGISRGKAGSGRFGRWGPFPARNNVGSTARRCEVKEAGKQKQLCADYQYLIADVFKSAEMGRGAMSEVIDIVLCRPTLAAPAARDPRFSKQGGRAAAAPAQRRCLILARPRRSGASLEAQANREQLRSTRTLGLCGKLAPGHGLGTVPTTERTRSDVLECTGDAPKCPVARSLTMRSSRSPLKPL